jgi:hypothetical protein
MAEELVELVAQYLVPGCEANPWLSRPLSQVPAHYAEKSVGAAHWVQLSKALTRRGQWLETLRRNRRSHHETAACCRVINSHDEAAYDWPLAVLKLRASATASSGEPPSHLLSHTVPLSRHSLRMAYWAVAKEVHPDRLQTPLAATAMTVLNEAYRQAVLQFTVRDETDMEVIRLDALGLEHVTVH